MLSPMSVWVIRLPRYKYMHLRLSGESKLHVVVKPSVCRCSLLYVGPVIDWRPVQGDPGINNGWNMTEEGI